MKASVYVRLKPGVLDPEGKAIQQALVNLGFAEVEAVRQTRVIELDLKETEPAAAKARVDDMCRKLLANMVIESYSFDLEGAADQ